MNEEKRSGCGLLPSRKMEVFLCRHRREEHTSVKLIRISAIETSITLRPFILRKRLNIIVHRLVGL
jgi:hypothetical protein